MSTRKSKLKPSEPGQGEHSFIRSSVPCPWHNVAGRFPTVFYIHVYIQILLSQHAFEIFIIFKSKIVIHDFLNHDVFVSNRKSTRLFCCNDHGQS
mmetsp:Transcript_123/g.226  ORF Transcript_123/g.226 Transcript_123/m.226 type:complete len:95 (+) Transcript_123:1637-1921(+)